MTFRRLQAATIVDNVGDGAAATAVPLLAAALTGDPRLVGLASAAAALPGPLFSLPAGMLADRHDRGMLMRRAQSVQTLVAIVLAAAVALGLASVWLLAGAMFVLATADTVFGAASLAIVPALVGAADLHRANGRQFAVTSAARTFAGPAVGGVLFALGAALPFGLDAASFAVSALLLRGLPRAEVRAVTRTSPVEGLRRLAGNRLLRTLALLSAVNLFCFQFASVTLVLRVGPGLYGPLLAVSALGGVAGGLIPWRPPVPVALAGSVVAYVACGFSLHAYVLGMLLAVIGYFAAVWNVATVSLRQSTVPAELLGRVNAVYRMLGLALTPLGALAGGFVAHYGGAPAAYPLAGLLRGVALLFCLGVLRGHDERSGPRRTTPSRP